MRDHAGRLYATHGDASLGTRLLKLTEEAGEAAEAIISTRNIRPATASGRCGTQPMVTAF